MKSNIVLLGTYLSRATGIMYPCSYDKADGNQAFIVFTCSHLFDELEKLPEDGKDVKKFLNIQIFDDDGNIIDESEIKELKYHIPRLEGERFCDVAALLILIEPYKRISLETKIFNGELENRTTVYVEGYPVVMLDDEINQKVQLMGLSKQMFPDREEVGMYQIEDEYHWYNNFMDKKVLEGFSGSPVFVNTKNGAEIVGMNESVVNIENGENPFKIVYYLKFQHMLNVLRKSGCIFFSPLRNGSVQIDWVLNLKDELKDNKKKSLTLLMLGDSGAGKSSFARTFSYHSKYLMTTGGGQTTRTNIAYRFKLLSDNNKVVIHFLPEDGFVERMKNRNRVKCWNIFFREITELKSISIDDAENTFLSYAYKLLSIQNRHDKEVLEYLLESGKDDEYTKDITNIYNNIIMSFITCFEIEKFPIILDREKIENMYHQYKTRVTGSKSHSTEEALRKVMDDSNVANSDPLYSILGAVFTQSIKVFNWDNYYTKINDKFKPDWNTIGLKNREFIKGQIYSDEFLEKFITNLLNIEGYFALSEFDLDATEILINVKNELEKIRREKEEKRKEQLLDLEKFDIQTHIDEISETIYKITYKIVMESIYNEYKIICSREKEDVSTEINQQEQHLISFELNKMTPYETNMLTKCLRVINNKSYTGMVKSVEIEDEISDAYALILKRMNIKSITLLDTCGLNHVENDETSLVKVRNIITQYRDAGVIFEEAAVLYFKKLDAGRPDELRNIIPVIVRALPKAPMYCVFTGTDIFYGRNANRMLNVQWEKEKEEELPKPVRFVKNQDYESILERVGMRSVRKRHFGLVLKNNLIAFCGDKELVEKDIDVFISNVNNVRKLLASIAFNEYASLNMVNQKDIEYALEKRENKPIIEGLLKSIFECASVKNWKAIHHAVAKANYVRIHNKNRNEMGYEGVNRYRWSQLFHDAYDDIVINDSSNFLNIFGEKESMIVESALFRMADKYFLGEDNMLFMKRLPNHVIKNRFRLTLEKMYDTYENGRKIYTHNPYTNDDEENDVEFKDVNKEDAQEYLEDVLDFEKGLKDEIIMKEFCECFCEALLKQIEDDNKSKPNALININDDLRKAIDDLEISFRNKFGEEYDVYSILIQYLINKK